MVLSVFIAVLNIFQVPIKNCLNIVSMPVEKVFWKGGESTSVFFSSLFNSGSLATENENLKNENQSLLTKITDLQAIKKQLADARTMASAEPFQGRDFTYVMAGVMGLNASEDVITLDKGYDDGLSAGMPVVSGQKVVFGKISKVYKNFSEVLLISNKSNVLNVKIQNIISESTADSPADIFGVTRGSGNLGIYLDLVPIDSNINKGDIIVTSALEGVFPKDLLVGKVAETNKNDLKPFQTIKIDPFFDIKGAENLFIITDYKR